MSYASGSPKSTLKPQVEISFDQWGEGRSFAWISWVGGGGGYAYAEVKVDECGLCGRTVPVLQMDNGEAGPHSACEECIAKLFDSSANGTSYTADQKYDAVGHKV